MEKISNDHSGHGNQDDLEILMFDGEKDNTELDRIVADERGIGFEAAPWRKAEAHLNLGVDFLKAKIVDKAAAHLIRAQEISREDDPNPTNQPGAVHIRGLAHFNLGLTYLEKANQVGSRKEKYKWAAGAAEEFRQAVIIGDRAPGFQQFEFDAQRWLANTRNNFGILPTNTTLGLKDYQLTIQAGMIELLNILDKGEAALRIADGHSIKKERARLEKLQARIDQQAEPGTHLEELGRLARQVKQVIG